MDSCLVGAVHFVELVNAANSVVSKHQSSCLDAHISILIPGNSGRQACGTGRLAIGIDAPGDKLVDAFEKLRFGSGRIAYNEDVDVAPDIDLVASSDLVNTGEELEQ